MWCGLRPAQSRLVMVRTPGALWSVAVVRTLLSREPLSALSLSLPQVSTALSPEESDSRATSELCLQFWHPSQAAALGAPSPGRLWNHSAFSDLYSVRVASDYVHTHNCTIHMLSGPLP